METAQFEQVIRLIKKGETIIKACKKSGTSASTLHRTMTEEQKRELEETKAMLSTSSKQYKMKRDEMYGFEDYE